MPVDSWLAALLTWVRDEQTSLHRTLAAAVRAVQDEHAGSALLILAGLSFLYGVFHAVGPGHGKAVISAYAATAEKRDGNARALARAALLSMASALMQAVTAVLVVGAAFLLVQGGARWATRNAETILEPLSYATIAGVGLWMLVRGGRKLWRLGHRHDHQPHSQAHQHQHEHQHTHHHHHEHDGACCAVTPPPPAGIGWGSWAEMAGIVFAVGIRPCSGALLVLALAFGMGLWGAGIASAFTMALGTGLTVAALAMLASGSRALAGRLGRALGAGEPALARASALVALTGGGLIALAGGLLLADSLTRPINPFLG